MDGILWYTLWCLPVRPYIRPSVRILFLIYNLNIFFFIDFVNFCIYIIIKDECFAVNNVQKSLNTHSVPEKIIFCYCFLMFLCYIEYVWRIFIRDLKLLGVFMAIRFKVICPLCLCEMETGLWLAYY